jgi:hypothetical protein
VQFIADRGLSIDTVRAEATRDLLALLARDSEAGKFALDPATVRADMITAGNFYWQEVLNCARGQRMTLIEDGSKVGGRTFYFVLGFYITGDEQRHIEFLRVFEYTQATAGNIVSDLSALIIELARAGVLVVAGMTDNAANLLAALDHRRAGGQTAQETVQKSTGMKVLHGSCVNHTSVLLRTRHALGSTDKTFPMPETGSTGKTFPTPGTFIPVLFWTVSCAVGLSRRR